MDTISSQYSTTNFFRGGIYASTQDALRDIFQPNPTAARKSREDYDSPTKEQEENFMKENFS